MIKKISRNELRKKRHLRIRKKLFGTIEKPRACVFRSNRNMHIQFIDDESGKVIVGYSTQGKEFQSKIGADKKGNNIEKARAFGAYVAEKLKEKNISSIVFDRAGYKYHGKIKALADAMRESGIKF